jgi:orotate phosphoribosyltransferase
MLPFQQQFIQLSLAVNALKFGQFTLKSGRVSPYFFNTAHFDHGPALEQLGQCFAAAIDHYAIQCDMLLGPAYKGIPLACATAIAFAQQNTRTLPLCFNRKEPKLHGEGGQLMGAPLQGKVLIMDDVITAGTAKIQAIELIHNAGAKVAGILVALDRQEPSNGSLSAAQALSHQYQIPIYSIINLEQLITFIEQTPTWQPHLPALKSYRHQVGIATNA